MRTAFDFAPLYRSGIGFDRIVDMLENASRVTTIDNWPPYDIARLSEDAYRITVAVAGFMQGDMSVTQEQNTLVVDGAKPEDNREYLYRGIARRPFQLRFQLADHVKVTAATLENGLLTIELKRDIPEQMKPRRIEIVNAGLASERRPVEAQRRAA